MKSKILSTAMLFITALIWGFAFVAQVLGGDHLPPLTFNGTRFVLGGLFLIPLYLLFEKERATASADLKVRRKRTFLSALGGGCILFIASALQQYGTTLLRDPGKAGFITGLYTVLTPVFSFLIFRKRTGWNTWLGVILATAGLYLLCLRSGDTPTFGLGEIMLLIGAVFWAGHILFVDRFASEVSPIRFSSWQFLTCGCLNLLFALFTETPTAEGFRGAFWAIAFCGILSVGVGYTFQVLGQRHADPTYAAIIFSAESVFAAIGGILWNLVTPENLHVDQEILPVGYIGCVIIFAGIILSQIPVSSGRGKSQRPQNEKSQKG
jgi:drug/metabolite transporter (DMT)-like permease